MCYTFGDRGWRKGVVRGGNKHFPSATEQADFGAPRAEIQDLTWGKIRLFGCRWCGGAERISEEILGAQQHHRGSQRDIIPRPAAATSPRHFGNAIVFCFGRSSRSELRISSMALFAYLCVRVVSSSAMYRIFPVCVSKSISISPHSPS